MSNRLVAVREYERTHPGERVEYERCFPLLKKKRTLLNARRCLRSTLLLFYALLLAHNFSEAQSTKRSSKITAPRVSVLEKPTAWTAVTLRLFRDDSRLVNFVLVTSWIPGENHRGMLRYKLTALPSPSTESGEDAQTSLALPNTVAITSDEKFVNRVHACSISLNLYDHGGFILRKHLVAFTKLVDEQAHLTGLRANSSFQMDAQDYRVWISDNAGGSWSIEWNCPDS